MNTKNVLLLGGGALAVYLLGKGWNTAQGVKRLEYTNPKIKIGKVNLTGAELQMTIDLRNVASTDIYLQYFTGNVNWVDKTGAASKISSFSFDAGKSVVIKARSVTTVPFTLRISTLNAIQFIVKLVNAITYNTGGISTMLQVDGSMYAAGLDIPVKFNYDVKSNAVSGIGRVETQATIDAEIENYFASTVSHTPRERAAYASEFQKILTYMHNLTKSFNDVKKVLRKMKFA